ncbi:MAG: hypothetical protein AMJ72_04805 [Acidithiobacillales bacterium SM1_46]|nr:MAG: hypothetical protein AMJ72_04805 [Acidithiobacillales bacterium SM1_46]
MEHRWSERKQLPARVTVHSRVDKSFPAILRDLSLGGAFIETAGRSLPVNEPLVLSIVLGPDGDRTYHRLHAMVVRAARDGVGLMCLDCDTGTLGELRAVLDAAKATSVPIREKLRLIVS